MNNKIYSIELLRFLFMTIICLWHFRDVVPVCGHGYLAVEFYFILSGYLLYHSFVGGKYTDALDYTFKKIKRFYLPYILMLPICICLFYRRWWNIGIIDVINYFLVDGLMMQQSPLTFNNIPLNHPTWYITTLLFSGYLLYFLLQKKMGIELVIISMVGYGWLIPRYGALDVTLENYSGLLLLLRGLCGLSLGASLAMLKERINIPSKVMNILNYVSIYALLAFCYVCFTHSAVKENEAIVLASIVIFVCFQSNSLLYRGFNFKSFAPLGNLSFYMLLAHAPISAAIQFVVHHYSINGNLIFLTIIYLMVVVVSSVTLKWLEQKIRYVCNKA